MEEHFYLLWPLLVQYTPTFWSRKLATCFIPFLAILSSVVAFVYLDSHIAKDVIYRSTNFRMLSLSCGAVLAYNEEFIRASTSQLLSDATRALLLLGFLILLSSEVFTGFAPLLLFWGGSLFSCGAVIYVIRCKSGVVTSFLTSDPLRYVGSISYGLYLYHYLIYQYLGMNNGTAVPTGTAIFGLTSTFVLAAVSYKFFERPLVDLSNRQRQAEKLYGAAVSVAE